MTIPDHSTTPSSEALQAALHRFDALEPVQTADLRGDWRGEGVPTGHPMDGALEAYHWWGKRFESDEAVHPLLFETAAGRLVAVHPGWMRPFLPWLRNGRWPRAAWLRGLARSSLPLLATTRSQARLRMIEHRGVLTAAMIYDGLPIHDVFRRIDADTVLGCMDLKDDPRPFFFLLRRASASR